ncbi:hypothetical protein BDQ12DRAFT_720553 [Crucibulum laeve]|uniref:Uncharacterized protein n=1 Tax=Crucibulum laeve TaxID=68775 RepID=A0A5C3MKP5_9AGAR|nr:hypothetical protein BDQ12DRAFT_720553 [Crucibulum laeve]
MPTTRAQENISNAATVPNSNVIPDPAPEPVIPSKKTKKNQHLKEDLTAEAAGPPAKLTCTEHILEESEFSPKLPPSETTINHFDSDSGSGSIFPEEFPPELPPPEINVNHSDSDSDSGSGSISPKEFLSELPPLKTTANHSASGSDSGSEFEDNVGSTPSDESENIITPHKIADGKCPRPNIPISPSISRNMKSGQLSVAHSSVSSAMSECPTCESSSANFQSELPAIEDDLQGSSRITGGFSCGCTIVYNMADKDNEMDIDFATPQPVHDAIPHLSMHQDVQSKLAPVLEKLSGCYTPVAKSNPYIFVNEDNIWSIKGWYNKAIIENETIDWIASPSGQLTLPILMEGINSNQSQNIGFDALSLDSSHSDFQSSSTSVHSTSVSGSASTFASVSASVSASTSAVGYPFAINSVQHHIATALNIPFSLTDHQRGDIQQSYVKYLAIQDTRICIKQLAKDKI